MSHPTSGDPAGDAARRVIEGRAQAEFWADDYERRAREVGDDLAAALEAGGAGVRLSHLILGSTGFHDAARAARAMAQRQGPMARFLRHGVSQAPWSDDRAGLSAAHHRRAAARRKLARLEWRLRVARVAAGLPRAVRIRLVLRVTRAGRAALGTALQIVDNRSRRAITNRELPRVEVLLIGDRLQIARALRALRPAALGSQVSVRRLVTASAQTPGDAIAAALTQAVAPYVLVLCGPVQGPPGFVERLVETLDEQPLTDAVSAVVVRKGSGEHIDGGWRFDWQDGRVQLVSCGPADPPVVGGTCVLVRTDSVEAGLGTAGYSASAWALDHSLAVRYAGRDVAVAEVEVHVDGSEDALSPRDAEVLCGRWGPFLRRTVLDDLIRGGGPWCGRGLRVQVDESLGASCAGLGWTTGPASYADVCLDASGPERALRATWRDDDRCADRGAALDDAARAGGESLRRALHQHLRRPSVCLQLAPRDWTAANTSGDLFLARSLASALRDHGCWTRLQVGSEVGDPRGAALDVAVHLRGRGSIRLPRGQRRVLWHISHPDEVTHDELADYDLIAVASRPHAAALANEVEVPVRELLQFTDPAVFRPADDEAQGHELLFVGNWRSVFRPAVWAMVPTAHDLGLYGQGWHHLAPEYARAEHVPNEQLHRLYSSADVVLADHWDDMRRHGFVSNRICDALACEAFVISDDFPALHDLFAGGLETFATPDELREKVERYLADPEARVAIARRGRRLVLESHTVDRRAAELLELLRELDVATPRSPAGAARDSPMFRI